MRVFYENHIPDIGDSSPHSSILDKSGPSMLGIYLAYVNGSSMHRILDISGTSMQST